MGLDSYIEAEVYLYSRDNVELSEKLSSFFPYAKGEARKVVFDMGYWRKDWDLHNWFVRNIQGGEDNCGRYELRVDDLLEFKVWTQSRNVPKDHRQYTLKVINNCLEFFEAEKPRGHWVSIYYQSSW